MKIENYEGTADAFTFPYNPQTFTESSTKFLDKRDLPYSFTFLGFTNAMKARRTITLNGHFSGTDKASDYRALVKHINEYKLKKLYFATDKFYIVTGVNVQKTPTGTRPNHIDYVATFFSPFGLLFGDTQKSGAYNSAELNEGNIPTPIEKITGSVTSGNTVVIKDKNGNGIQFTASATGTFTLCIIKLTSENDEQWLAEYIYGEVGSTRQTLKCATNAGSMILQLDASETLNTRFNTGSATITNITPIFYFRDGWSSE
jgi:hypothetical protein